MLFGLVFILTGILALIGMKVSEAKKPRETQWQVAIPRIPANPLLDNLNMTGFSKKYENGNAIFKDQGSVEVDVEETRKGGRYRNFFRLRFASNTSDYGVQIDSVILDNHSFEAEANEGPCWFLPPCNRKLRCYNCNSDDQRCFYNACDDCDVCVDCMECALNNKYPTTTEDPDETTYAFWLTVGTDQDIYGPDAETPGKVAGRIYLYILDYNDLYRAYHSMTCESPGKTVGIVKNPNADEWTISNGGFDGDTTLTCKEWYHVGVDIKGNPLPPPRQYDQTVMTATTALGSQFKFGTIWTKTTGQEG